MGKADEALSISLNAKELLLSNDAVLIDDLTLSTLQIVFQRLDHRENMLFAQSLLDLVNRILIPGITIFSLSLSDSGYGN